MARGGHPVPPGLGVVLGVGVDAVDVERFRTVLARRPRLAGRLFTAGERAEAGGRSDPVPALAVRFAAKEAVMKAFGVGLGAFPFADVEVVRCPSGAPTLLLARRACELGTERGVAGWHVSLTHTATVAVAVVIPCAAAAPPRGR